ncbi:hypothetical protein ACWCXH_35620 [Kitasatospora sp. NPDC001660]
MTMDQPTLVDLPEHAPACLECGRALQVAATGRPARYCGATCRSAAHRRRRAEAAQAAPQPTVPAPRGRLMELAAAVQEATNALADALDTEPGEAADSALQTLRAAAAHLLDQAALERAARNETPNENSTDAAQPAARPGATDNQFRRGNETPASPDEPEAAGFRDGDETGGARLRDLVDQHLAQQTADQPAPPTTETPEPPAELTVPTDPMLRRLPDTDVAVALDPRVFGDWWSLAGWTVNPDVCLVLGEGHQVGWTERALPGLEAGKWVAVYEGYFIGDQATQEAMLHDTPEQAARTVQQAYLQNL